MALGLWGYANTLLSRQLGRRSGSLSGVVHSCFGYSRTANLACLLLLSVLMLVLALSCLERQDAVLRRLEASLGEQGLVDVFAEWRAMQHCPDVWLPSPIDGSHGGVGENMEAAADTGALAEWTCDTPALTWPMLRAAASRRLDTLGRLGLLVALVLALRAVCVVVLLYHADDPQWRWLLDGKATPSGDESEMVSLVGAGADDESQP